MKGYQARTSTIKSQVLKRAAGLTSLTPVSSPPGRARTAVNSPLPRVASTGASVLTRIRLANVFKKKEDDVKD